MSVKLKSGFIVNNPGPHPAAKQKGRCAICEQRPFKFQ
jgi:hypothetical protein